MTTNTFLTRNPSTGAFEEVLFNTAVMSGATSSSAGIAGLVPAPSAGDQTKYFRADGTWHTVPTGGGGGGGLSGLDPNLVVVTDDTGTGITSTVSATKLGYLSDVTSNIQAQINAKTALTTTQSIAIGYVDVTTGISGLIAAKQNALSTSQLNALNSTQLTAVTALTVTQINQLADNKIAALESLTVDLIDSVQHIDVTTGISGLIAAKQNALSTAQISGLTAVSNNTTTQIGYLASAQVSALVNQTTTNINNLSSLDVTSSLTTLLGAKANSASLGTMSTQNANNVAITGGTITGQSTPTNPSDVATKNYVDAATAGLSSRTSCRYATTGPLTANYSNGTAGVNAVLTNSGTLSAFQIDSTNVPAQYDRILVKDQSTPSQNGAYSLTTVGSGSVAWQLTRVSDFDQGNPNEVVEGAFFIVEEGTLNGGKLWIETGVGPFTVGTTPITFTQLNVSGTLLSSNNLSDVANIGTARTSLGLGTIATQSASSVNLTGGTITGITDLAVADGGTGASTASTALSNLGGLPLTGGNLSGAINTSVATVAAAATTSAIWTAAGNEINFTDASNTVITNFPAAPQAGASRILICANAGTVFTNNANIFVQGAANYTVAVGDVITVHAVTTSTFRVNIQQAASLGGGLPLSGGTLSGALNFAQGSDVASASTVNLSTATGNYVHITGTTTITAITLAQGYQRIVEFTGILILTNGANLILPGGANITTAAGDTAVFIGEASSVVRCVSYIKASGKPIVGLAVADGGTGAATASTALSNLGGLPLAGGSMTGALNFAQASVASDPTASAIWAAAGNEILFTGTSTITNFPAAPFAGATRVLICSSTPVFTNNANLFVQGNSNYSAAAGDVITVHAITTSTFRLNIQQAASLGGSGMANPMTTGGDVIYGGTSGVATRLANGSVGQVLTSSGSTSAPTWVNPAQRAFATNFIF